MNGYLYVAATPIGNLADTTQRLAQVLQAADLVLAEDTRLSGRLMQHLGLKKPLRSLHEHNEDHMTQGLLEQLEAGQTLVLISDAGTPLISDPGYRLIEAVHSRSLCVVPVPGPSAVTAALSVAGLPTNTFTFRGFLSSRNSERRRQLTQLVHCTETQVLFESCHRVVRMIDDAVAVLGAARPAFIAREMTKMHEQYVRDDLAGLARQLANGQIPQRGEFVIIVGGAPAESPVATVGAATLLATLADELPASQAAKLAAKLTDLTRAQCYEQIQSLKSQRL